MVVLKIDDKNPESDDIIDKGAQPVPLRWVSSHCGCSSKKSFFCSSTHVVFRSNLEMVDAEIVVTSAGR